VTHWHHDHLGGVPSVLARFGDVPVRKFMPDVQEPTFGGEGAVDPYTLVPKHRFTPLHDGEVLRTEGATLRVMHTPGHANDHVVLIHEEEKAMFSGDNVLGIGTTVFNDLAEYVNSLERMQAAVREEGLTTLYCGHGPVVSDATGKLGEYLAHRWARINQVREVLQRSPGEAWTSLAVARKLYTEVPANLLPAAAGNTLMALLKLERDGTVEREPGQTETALDTRWRLSVHSRL